MTPCTLTARPLPLRLAQPFGLSRWTHHEVTNILVELTFGDIVGQGEGAPNARYGETAETAIALLAGLPLDPPTSLAALESAIATARAACSSSGSAQAALEMALWDAYGKHSGQSLAELWGLSRRKTPPTSFSIGLDTPVAMAERAAQAARAPILKLKLGGSQDLEIVSRVRAVTDKPLWVDVNEGWRDRKGALRLIEALAKLGVTLVEQPLPANQARDLEWLRLRSPLPLIGDESCRSLRDLPRCQKTFHGVNIKLDKCGGLDMGRKMIAKARALGLQVMVGCMVSSSLAITAAAHLAVDADYVDLDGHLLLAQDPFAGLTHLPTGELQLPTGPGLGVLFCGPPSGTDR